MRSLDEDTIIRRLHDESTRYAAFTEVVNAYKEPLYWQIRRMVVSHDDTDDILQNTFIKAWNGLNAFRGESKLSTWLYRIATNETLNFLERQRHALGQPRRRGMPRGSQPAKRPVLRRRRDTAAAATSHRTTAAQTTASLHDAILQRNEIRGHEPGSGNQRRSP